MYIYKRKKKRKKHCSFCSPPLCSQFSNKEKIMMGAQAPPLPARTRTSAAPCSVVHSIPSALPMKRKWAEHSNVEPSAAVKCTAIPVLLCGLVPLTCSSPALPAAHFTQRETLLLVSRHSHAGQQPSGTPLPQTKTHSSCKPVAAPWNKEGTKINNKIK